MRTGCEDIKKNNTHPLFNPNKLWLCPNCRADNAQSLSDALSTYVLHAWVQLGLAGTVQRGGVFGTVPPVSLGHCGEQASHPHPPRCLIYLHFSAWQLPILSSDFVTHFLRVTACHRTPVCSGEAHTHALNRDSARVIMSNLLVLLLPGWWSTQASFSYLIAGGRFAWRTLSGAEGKRMASRIKELAESTRKSIAAPW